MTKVAPGVALRAERHRNRRAVVALAITGMLGAACGTGAATHAGSGPSASYQQPGSTRPGSGPSASHQQPGSTAGCNSVATCYGPQQIEAAYGIVPLRHRGIDGRGQTVVLPELAEPQFPLPASDIRQDLVQFDKLFGLPAATLQVNASLAPSASPWLANGEEVLDAEMVHAVAPGATISLVMVGASSLDDPASGVRAAVAAIGLGSSVGDVISISAAGQTGGEHCDTPGEVTALHAALQAAAQHHVTVVGASGDVGAVGEPCHVVSGLTGGPFPPVQEVNLPAADPLVLGAGGTTLTASHKTGAYVSESAWDLPYGDPGSQFQGSGGGFSRQLSRPAYQDSVPGIGSHRGVPDVAADAAPHIAVVTATGAGIYTISGHGGTSASAPLWAGLVALADQYAGRPLGFVNAGIYRVAESSKYHAAFHDVTTGHNTVAFPPTTINGYATSRGWDAVTGWGSPDASVLVPLLTRDVHDGDANGL
jgi:subtilase family serine protease